MKAIEDINDDRALVAMKAETALEAVEEALTIAEDPDRADLLAARRALYYVLAVFK